MLIIVTLFGFVRFDIDIFMFIIFKLFGSVRTNLLSFVFCTWLIVCILSNKKLVVET